MHQAEDEDTIDGVFSGKVWKSGGKVIKNVSGYNMSKLLMGFWGTLSAVQPGV